MRILGFVISAVVLHLVLLALSLDNSSEQIDEFRIGVVLVERQVDPFAADAATAASAAQESFATDSSAHSALASLDRKEVSDTQEQVDKPTVQGLAVEVDDSKSRLDIQRPVAAEKSLPPEDHQPPLLREAIDHRSPEEMSLSLHQQIHHVATEAASLSQDSLAGPEGPSAEPAVGAVGKTAGESVALQVSALPRYGHHPAPSYPGIARRRGWEGTVEFNVRVLATGEVAEITLKNSSGYKSLDDAARRAIIRWRFIPAKRYGKVVESWVVVPVHFILNSQARTR